MPVRALVAVITTIFVLGLLAACLPGSRPGYALPEFSRNYGVTCQTCHSVPPRLNTFGLAFQADHFHWPDGHPPKMAHGLNAFPLSGMATLSREADLSGGTTNADFRALELFLSDGFRLGTGNGGYFVDNFAATQDVRAGDLDNAFIALPLSTRNDQYWALTAGQFTPLMYQYDPVNSLTDSLPGALDSGLDAFSPITAVPGLRLEFSRRPDAEKADGDYASLGAPFQGHLTLNSDSRLYGPRGTYAHAFRRHGDNTLGVFGYVRGNRHQEGLIGTGKLRENLYLLGVADAGHDDQGSARHFSLEVNAISSPWLAFTGRLESVSGDGLQSDLYPVAAVTYYPFRQSGLRLVGETIQAKGNRSVNIFAFIQF